MAPRRLTALRLLLVVVAMAAPWPACVHAGQADRTAAAFVQGLGDEVVAVLRTPGAPAHRKAALRAIFLRTFDVEAIGRFVLGLHWRGATQDQRARYRAVFPDYVADIYAARFASYSGEKFVVIREQKLDNWGILVVTEIRHPNAPKVDVDFRIARRDNGYKIVDVTVERLSLVITKRDEFAAFIRRRGLDALIASLERRVGRPG